MLDARTHHGAPLSEGASCFFLPARVLPCLLMVCLFASPLFADNDPEPVDWLSQARDALVKGDKDALRPAVKALAARPLGAEENVQVAITLFWMGQFDDAARYMRRGLTTDVGIAEDIGLLAARMPKDDIAPRLNQLAVLVEDNAELCFLAGVLLVMHDDRERAVPFLVRAEQLAGADAQASRLAGDRSPPRSATRGVTALRQGEFRDAVRSFAFAAADNPTAAEHFAGLAIALAGLGDIDPAAETLQVVAGRRMPRQLIEWMHGLEPPTDKLLEAATAILGQQDADTHKLRMAAVLLLVARHYHEAREACVRILMEDRLDEVAHELMQYMDANDLRGGPALNGSPAEPDPNEPPTDPTDAQEPTQPATMDDVRRHVRRGDFELALDAIDPHVTDEADPDVYFVLFAILVGVEDLEQARLALQAWYAKASRDDRTRLNSLRDLFGSNELFTQWQLTITTRRDEDPNAGLPRLLNSFVLVSRGRYSAAREELLVARIEYPGDAMALSLDRILSGDDFERDVTPDGVPDDPSPSALFGRAQNNFRAGDYEQARNNLLRAAEADADLPFINESLFRVYFAMADYSNAVRVLERMLDELDDLRVNPRTFRVLVVDGYENRETFEEHLEELRDECVRRPLAAGPFLLLGVIEHDLGNLKQSYEALKRWYDIVPGERHSGAVRLYEEVRKRTE
jgi:tetratricopeptide (TPR) repeat protein